MTTAKERAKARRARRPIYLVVRRLADPETGELLGALVPAHPIDQRLLKERKFHVDREVRAELKQPRNAKFHRLLHAVGQVMVDNVEGWEHLSSHDAVKRLQRESGTCCEEVEIDIPNLGKLLAKQAESMAFDDMPEDRFRELFEGITNHIDANYSADFTTEIRGDYLVMIQGDSN